jgi:hypothetical protein
MNTVVFYTTIEIIEPQLNIKLEESPKLSGKWKKADEDDTNMKICSVGNSLAVL